MRSFAVATLAAACASRLFEWLKMQNLIAAITLAKHAVFDRDQLLLDNEGPGLGGKQLQRRAITQRGFGLAQPSRGIRGLSSEDQLGAGRDARDPDIVTDFSCSH